MDENKILFYKKFHHSTRYNFNTNKINDYINQIRKNEKNYYIRQKFAIWNEIYLIRKCDENKDNPPIFIDESQIYNTIKTIHERFLHSGIKKTHMNIRKKFVNIKLRDIQLYISICPFCMKKKNVKRKFSRYSVKYPIISSEFNQRAQVDLIDVRMLQQPDVSYILNYQDNLTKFVSLKPLVDKSSASIKTALAEIFNLFGAPKILHTDNGGEFRSRDLINNFLKRFWPDIIIIRGKPYNPQSQGSVERSNGHIKQMMSSLLNEDPSLDLKYIIPFVQYCKNVTFHRTIKNTPYKVVFGQDPSVETKIECISIITEEEEEEKEEFLHMIDEKITIRKEALYNIQKAAINTLTN